MNLRAIAFVTALACMGLAAPSWARDVPSLLGDFRIASWAGGDGITLGAVRTIVQDRDGYLWLASDAGQREVHVLQLAFEGQRNREIAAILSISEETVQVHLKNIFMKLEVHDRTGAVYVALRRGIIHVG